MRCLENLQNGRDSSTDQADVLVTIHTVNVGSQFLTHTEQVMTIQVGILLELVWKLASRPLKCVKVSVHYNVHEVLDRNWEGEVTPAFHFLKSVLRQDVAYLDHSNGEGCQILGESIKFALVCIEGLQNIARLEIWAKFF